MSGSSRRAYDAWHAPLAPDSDAATPWYGLVRRHLDPARDLAGKRVLEIGCGRGEFAVWLAAHPAGPARVTAADVSPVALRKGRALVAARTVCWLVGDIERIAHADGTFDTVISCETVEHLHQPARAVAELARVLRPGGRLFLTTPNYLGVWGLYRGYVRLRGRRYTETGQPVNRFTTIPRTRRWITAAGLVVRRFDAEGHYLLLPGRAPRRLRALDRVGPLRWLAHHSLFVAERP